MNRATTADGTGTASASANASRSCRPQAKRTCLAWRTRPLCLFSPFRRFMVPTIVPYRRESGTPHRYATCGGWDALSCAGALCVVTCFGAPIRYVLGTPGFALRGGYGCCACAPPP
ncbi:hypothetical protein GCM10022220_13150 [Actinocatenispora rupis]|uniref:Uncharacterized protein n=1 Tax=Actinocatenispora rupis TaxID=519421 RepID=A0A8J3NBK1_9ACTN|nr:hypothetical protein Aru02nite_16360 [Actinocatenispora rupis]